MLDLIEKRKPTYLKENMYRIVPKLTVHAAKKFNSQNIDKPGVCVIFMILLFGVGPSVVYGMS